MDGIVYKTHFAIWEKPAKPVSSREMDATHVRAQSFSRWPLFFSTPFFLLATINSRSTKKSIKPICLIDFRFLILLYISSSDDWIFRCKKEFHFPRWHFQLSNFMLRIYACSTKKMYWWILKYFPKINIMYKIKRAGRSNTYLINETQYYNTSHLFEIHSCLLL